VPNDHRNVVRLGEVIAGVEGRFETCRVPLFLGKDAKGQPLVFDLAEMPHLLMAGRTGTGKSVCLNAMILSILMTKRPDEVKMILIDPKKVELSQYKRIPHLMHPVVTDMKRAESILAWACEKMDERYEFLRRAEVRNIQAYKGGRAAHRTPGPACPGRRLAPHRRDPEADGRRGDRPDQGKPTGSHCIPGDKPERFARRA
jgi:S-DNA-T family DNA segregation ATPase FtsK/SpoIIIE